MLLILLLVVRDAPVKSIALLAIVDGILLFLPFFLTMVSERAAIIAFYERSPTRGYRLFATGYIIVFSLTVLSAIIWLPIQAFINEDYIFLSFLVIIAAAGNGLFNIQLQRYIVQENFTGLATSQAKRGVVVIFVGLTLQYLDVDAAYTYPATIFFGSLVAISGSMKATLSYWEPRHLKLQIKYLFKICYIALIILFFGFVIANAGRFFLEINSKEQDLAILLLYLKTALLTTVAMTPFATFLKPLILKEFRKTRNRIPKGWHQLIYFSFFVSVGTISSFNVLWAVWGVDELKPDYFSFAICLVGSTTMWLMSSIIELYFEQSSYIKKKIIVFGLPSAFLVLGLFLMDTSVNYEVVLAMVSISQFFILSLGLFTAFKFREFYKEYFSMLLSLGLILLIGYWMNSIAASYAGTILFNITTAGTTALCGGISLYYLFKYSHK